MHGIASSAKKLESLIDMITRAHPGTEVLDALTQLTRLVYVSSCWQVTNVDAYNDLETFTTIIDTQVDGVYDIIKPVLDKAEDGVIMIGFSQGVTIIHNSNVLHCNVL